MGEVSRRRESASSFYIRMENRIMLPEPTACCASYVDRHGLCACARDLIRKHGEEIEVAVCEAIRPRIEERTAEFEFDSNSDKDTNQ
jgi:hypothetical protein